jgi:hypothetical protein
MSEDPDLVYGNGVSKIIQTHENKISSSDMKYA